MQPPKAPGKKKPRRKRRGQKAQELLQQLQAPKPKPVVDFTDKDAWGYNFAQPMWRLDPGVSEALKRDPKDRERERTCALLLRELHLDAKRITQGFDSEDIPWGVLRAEDPQPLAMPLLRKGVPAPKASPVRAFCEAIRTECKRARNGLLGIAQVHYLASKHGLLTTLRAKARAAAFPLDLDIEETTLKEPFFAKYVLQIDRVFYPIDKKPKTDRFAPSLCVADGFRLLDNGGEAAVRTPDRKAIAAIVATLDRDNPMQWQIERAKGPAITLVEARGQAARAELRVAEVALGSIELNGDPKAHVVDFTLRFDGPADRDVLLGLLVVYLDAWLQRRLGVLGRARVAREDEDEEEEDDDDELGDEDDEVE